MSSRLRTLADVAAVPAVVSAALIMKALRKVGVRNMPRSKRALEKVGVFPILDHYYEPQFAFEDEYTASAEMRQLPGIDWNLGPQLELLGELARYNEETLRFPRSSSCATEFHLDNNAFGPGDAEMWYSFVRYFKPAKIVEIGSGNSTLLARDAILKTKAEDSAYTCEHICIEPYEMPWLESTGVQVVREKVETLDFDLFESLGKNDFLFIDSSHIVRPAGDVLFEFLEVLPRLNSGVIVHVHDIFSPRNYPADWIEDDVKFWNEQYILESFLSHNDDWEILCALNSLSRSNFEAVRACAPSLTTSRNPGSFYMRRR